jgi:hypothetical protein
MSIDKIINYLLITLCVITIITLPFVSFSAFMAVSIETATIGKFLIYCVVGAIMLELFFTNMDEN